VYEIRKAVVSDNIMVKKSCNACVVCASVGSDVPRSTKTHYYSSAVKQLRSFQGLTMSIASLVHPYDTIVTRISTF
jgi:hypothetical protein